MKNLYSAFLCMLVMLSASTQTRANGFWLITGNTIGTDQTICQGSIPASFTGSTPGGGIGIFTYQWIFSTTSATAGYANIAGATAQNYSSPSLAANRWFKRIVISGIERDTSAPVAVTVTPLIIAASNVVTAAQTICTNTAPALLTGTSPTGGNGSFTYQWQSSPDNVTFTNISGANTINYQPPVLTANTWYRRSVFSGGCTHISGSVKMTVTPVINPGTNNITNNQSICTGQTPLPLAGSTPTGATGAFTYLWESSTTSAVAGYSTAAGTSNGINYTPGALIQPTYYHRIASSGGCTDISTPILINVVSSPPGNPAVFGNGVWNVYGYSDNAFGTYAGFYTEPLLSFSTTNRYTNAQAPSSASNYQGCLMPTTNFSVSMKQTNFTPGTYQINLTSLDDNLTIFLNGVQIYTHGCCVAVATPINNIWTGTLGASDQMELQWTQANGPSFLGLQFVPVTPTPLIPGTIAQNLQVCYGEVPPGGFTNTASPTSGCTLTGVQWQKSIDSVTWVPIAGATALTYTETAALTQTTWYRRMATDACNNALPSNPVKVTVNVIAPGDPTVYGNNTWNVYVFQGTGTPGAYNAAIYKGYYTEPLLSFNSTNRWANTASPSNASGYQGCVVNVNNTWVDYKRTNFTPAIYQIDIPYHDDVAYLFVNGVQVFTHNGCCDSHTNVWTGPLGPTDQVEYRVNQGGGPSSEALTLTPVTPPVLTSGSITPSQTVCAGDVPPTAFTESVAPTGGCTIKNYSWDYSTDNGATWTTISGATAISYTPTTSVYSQTLFRRTVYDVCGNSAVAQPDTVYMNNSAPGNPAVFGNNTWNVYCFQDVNYSIYAGYYTEPLLTFATTNRYPSTSPPSTASGYLGCQLINTYYSVSMKRTGFAAGTYQIDVTADDDYTQIYINGTLVSSLTYPTIQNNVWTGNLGPTDQIEVRWRNNAGPGQTGVRFTLVTPTPLLPGSIVAYNPNLCFNDLPIINEVTPASGGCFVNYAWQSSIDGGTTWTTIAGATGNSYTATVSPTTNIQYRRVANDVCGNTVFTAPVSFTQTSGTIGNPSVYGNGVWNVYAYDAQGASFATAQYLGYYVEPLLSFNSLNRWGANGAPSDASGYQGCQVDQDNHWVSYRQTNFTPGTYQIDIPYHDDDAYLFINGVQVWSQTGCCVASTNVWTGNLGATDQVEFRWREFFGASSGAVNFTNVTPPTTVIPGTIAANQTICTGTIPASFTSTLDASSSCSIAYQWQSSPDNATWTDISGATTNIYTSGTISAKTYFRRKATNACAVIAYSNTIIVDVYSTVLTGGTISANQTFCSGTAAATLNNTALPTGGDGNYVYQWQSSLDNIGWSNIAGATATTYAPGSPVVTTYYRRNVTACGASALANSNVITITVNGLPSITTQPGAPTACANGSTSVAVVAKGTALTYQWQLNTGSGWGNVPNAAPYTGTTTATLGINPVTAGMNGYQYRVVISGTCTPAVTSNIVSLTVGTNPVISAQPVNTSACVGSNMNFNVTASGTGLTYQWQQKVGATWTNLVDDATYSGSLTSVLTISNVTLALNTNNNYRCIINTSCAGTVTSNTAVLTVVNAVNNVIGTDQTICTGSTAANLTGTAATTYLWQSSTVSSSSGFVNASGVNNGQNYAPNPVSTTTYYQRIAGNGTCTSTSNVVTITLNNTPITIQTQPSNQAICAGGNASFTAAATGSGTLTYQWYENGVAITDGGIYSGSTTTTLTLTGATAGMNGNTYYMRVFASGCSASFKNTNNATLTTNNGPVVLTNQADFTTCQGSSVQLNMTASGIGLTYQWQFNSGSGWNNLSNFGSYSNVNGNSLRINPTTAAMSGYQYRVIVTGTCSPFTATSATTTMTVNSPVANNSISNSQTLCAGTPAPFTGSTPTGGTGTYTYQWYLNTGSGWFAIAGATGINYSSGPLTQTTQFLRQVTSGACAATNSIAITVTIQPATSTTDPGNTTVCAGTNATFSVTGTGSGLSYQWQVNTGSGWTNIINGASYTGVTTASLTVIAPPFSSNGYQFRCVVSGNCSPPTVTSNAATLTVSPVAVITAQPSNVNSCQGSTVTYKVTATGVGLTYQWMEKVGAGAFTNITDGGIYSGSSTSTLTLTGITTAMNTNQYQCVITLGSCPVNTAAASLTVNGQPALVITNPAAVCAPSTVDITAPAVTAGSNLAGGILTYWNDITFTSPLSNPSAVATSGTYYIRVATSAICYDIKPVVVTINATITNNIIASSQSICTGTAPAALTGGITGGGTGSFTYQWQTSTDNITYTNIPGAINPGYSPGSLTVNTWYKRTVNSGVCTNTSAAVQITIVPYPAATISYTGSPYCATGTATVTQTGQAGGTYSSAAGLSVNSSTGTVNLAASTPGGYTVTYNFTNGTCSGSTTASINVVVIPTLVITNPAAVCSPSTVDITVAAVTAGSTAGLTYTYFTDAAGTVTLTTPTAVAASGTYYIKGTAGSGCSNIQPVVVTINPKPTVVITNPAAVCAPGIVDITATAVTAGSTAGLTYTYFTDAAGTVTLTTPTAVAASGTYYIKGTTASGCSDIKPVVVTINPKPTVTITNPAAVCAPGTVDITAAAVTAGSTAGLTYTYFTDAAGTITLTTPTAVAASGTYYIRGSTAAGCSDIKPVVVTINPKPTVVITNPAAVCAPGTVDITAAAVTAGSTAGLTYTYFTDAAGTITLTTPTAVAASGTYYIKGTTASGCSDIKPVIVTVNPKPTVTITNPAAVCAPGTADITVAAVTAGSTAGLTYTYFTDAAGTITLTTPSAVAASGTYYIKGSTAAGCSDIKPVVVTINPKPTVVITNPAAACAPGTVNLTLAAVTAGSTAGLTYTYFTDAAGTITLTTPTAVASSGTYYIKGSTGAGCSDIKPVVVTINPKPTVTITNPAAVCAPGTVDITAAAVTAGSTAGLTYTYFTDAAGTITLTTPTAVAASGTYYIKGTTGSGCSDIKPVVVTINPKPTVTITNPAAVCSPSTVDITAAAVTAGSTAGLTYTYFTDAAGTITLTTPTAVTTSGTYYIKGTTGSGCSDIKPVVVTINPKPTVTITNPAAVCAPGTVDITAAAVTAGSTAGLTYTYFSDAAGTITLTTPTAVTTSGTYYIKGSTASGCSDIKPVVVTINPKPTVTITNPAAVCSPSTVNITAAAVTAGSTAGLTYTYFTDAAGTITLTIPTAVAASGTYYIKGTTGAGCSDIKPVVVTINPKPTVVITNPAAVCAPGTVDITAAAVTAGSTAGLTYTYFTDAAGTITLTTPTAVTTSGTYYIKGSTGAGCSDIKPVVVTINPKPTVVITNPAAVCAPGTVDITAAAVTAGSTAGLTYTYFTDAAGTITLTTPAAVAASGTYYIKGSTGAGCSDIKPVVVTINPKPTVTITNPAAVCSPSTVDITVAAVTAGSTAGLTYTYFTDAAGTVTLTTPTAVAASGTYYIKGSTVAGCSDIKPVVVTINPKPTVTITNPAAVCSPSTVDITAAAVTAGSTAGLTYTYFTDAAGTITLATPTAVTTSGTYYIKGSTGAGCSDIKPVVVTINPKPTVVITNPAAVCAPGTVDITAAAVTAGSTAGLTYTYFTDAAGTITLTTPTAVAASGTYYIKGTTAAGCSDIKPVVVTINPKPTVTITNPAAVCAPGTVDITAAAVTAGSTAGLTYTYFTDAAGTITLTTPTTVAASGTYYIKGTTGSGCSDIKQVVVTINPKPTVTITNPAAVCAPSTVDITAAAVTAGSTAGLTYTYFTDAAGTITLTTPTAVATSGTYYIKGTTGSGCSDIKPVVVTINPKPTVTITNPAAVCAPGTVNLTLAAVTAGSTAGLTYTYFTDAAGTITLTTPTAVAASGTYYIKGTTGSGCSDIKPVVVTINPKPTVVITNPAAVCAPGTVDITAAAVTAGSTAGLTYTYFTDAAGTITLTTPTAVAASGTYYIKGSTGSGCSDIKPVVVTINPKPTVTITNPAAVCAPATVNLTLAAVTAGSTAGLTYTYFTDAAGTITLATPTAVAASGTYYIKGTTGSGCSDIKPVAITINPKPTVVITNPAAACSPSTVDITAAAVTAGSTAGLTYTYFTDAAGTITLTTPTAVAASGTYYIKGSTGSGCSDIKPVVVTINPKPTVTITNPAAVCAPGTVDITAAAVTAGSTAGLTYTYFTDAAGTITLTTPTAIAASGTYYIKGSAGSGCSDIKPVVVTINPLPVATISYPGSPYCATGTANVTQTGQAGGTYAAVPAGLSINAATGAINLASSSPNTYTVTYSFTNGTCSNTTTTSVNVILAPSVVITNPAAVCTPSAVDLTAASVTAGSTAGLTYTYFTDAAGTITLTTPTAVAASGTYYIKGSAGSGCSDIKPVIVTVNAKPTVTTSNPAAVCAPLTVDLTAAPVTAGSTAGLTYTYFTDAAGTVTLSSPNAVATSGTYYIKGTNGSGCSDIKPVVVTINPLPTAAINYAGSPYCSTGTATVTLTGQAGGTFTAPGGVAINASTGDINLVTSTPGTYTITYSFSNGTCSNTTNASVTINALPVASISYAGSPYCATGTATVTQTGQAGGTYAALPAGLSINAATGTINLSASTANTYTVTYSFGNGTCSNTTTANVVIKALPAVVITNPAAVCAPATVDITATAVTAGSTAGLTYTYFTDAAGTVTLTTPTAVAANGTYYIKGTTASGCSDIKPVVVTINPKPTVVITNPAAVCAPGTIDITAAAITAGSTAGLTYTYFTDAAGTITLTTPTAVTTSGTYYIKGTTGAGCSDIKPVVVTINPKPTVTITNPAAVCSPSTVDITAAAVTTGSTAGLTYTYFTDAAGTVTLTTPTAVATSGTYYIKGTTASGCSDIKPVVVTINPKPTVTITNPAAVCSPSTVDITAAAVTTGSTAGLTYTYFTDAAGTVTLTTPTAITTSGTYYIKGTTAAGCSDIKPVVVTINPKPTVTITNPAAVCSPSTVDITAAAVTAGSTAGLTYTYFTDAAGTITLTTPTAVTTSGTYYIKGTTGSGCSDIKPVVVTINPKPTVVITNPAAVCAPGTVDITAAAVTTGSTAGLTYTYFTDAAGTITLTTPTAVTTSGTYYIKGSTGAGCSDIKPVVVTINPKPTVTITNPAAVCAPGTVDITAAAVTAGSTAGLTYTYFTDAAGTITLTTPTAVAASGTYYIKGTTAAGCSDIKPVVVTINPKPTVTITNPAAVCAPGTVDITAAAVTAGSTAGLTYTYFSDAAATVTVPTPNAVSISGTYYIKGTNGSGCSDIKPVVVTINPLPTATINYAGSPYCSTGTATVTLTGQTGGTFTAPGGVIINASTGDINLVTSTPGTYTITYNFTNGTCSSSTNASVTINALPTAVINYAGSPYCATGTASVTQTGQAGGTYSALPAGLSVNSSTGVIDLSASAPNTYTVTYSFGNGTCTNTTTATVVVKALPTVVITNPTAVCAPGTVDITAVGVTAGSTVGLTYTYFTDAAGTITLTIPTAVTTSGTYYIKGTTASGCSDIKPVVVTINPKPTVTITNPAAVCAPGTVDITTAAVTAGSTAGLTYTYFTDAAGTVTLTTPAAVAASGTYYIKGSTGSGCSDIKPVVVTINPKPSVVVTNPSAVCAPGTVDITAAAVTAGSTAGLTYTYFTDAAGTVTLATPTAIAASGTYYIKGTTGSGCSDFKPVVVTINAQPVATISYTGSPYCATGTATVTLTGQAGGTYSAAGGVVINAVSGDINLVTSTAGTYTITYNFSNGTCGNSTTTSITINALPTAAISYAGSPYCATGTATVSQTGQAGGTYAALPAGLSINAGTGAIDLSSSAANTYTVTYSFGNGTCGNTTTATVVVKALPTVVITNPAAVCSPSAVDITAAAVTAGSTAGLTYTYFTDAAGTIILTTPTAVTTSGTYYIKGTTAAGCSDIKPVVVTINPKPTVVVTNPAAICSPSTVDITAAAVTAGSTAGLTYTYFTDAAGTITLTTPTAVAAGGTYYIKGTTGSGCSDIKPVVVTINLKPTVVITNPAAVCSPSTVDITAAAVIAGSTAGLTFTYFTDAAGTITLTTPTAVAASGTYYIRGTTGSGCSDIKSVVVAINPKPTVVITNPAAVCAPGTVNLTLAAVTAGSTAGLTYTYFTDAAGTTTLATPAAVATSGTYYIKGATASGCSDIQPVTVTINPLPIATINYAGSPYCATGIATVTQTGQAGGTFSSTAGLVINAATGNINLVASTPGTYTITYTFTNGTCSNTTTAPVTINALPTATIAYTASPYCATGTATVTLTGQAGGVFSAPAAVSINASTGDINLATSTPGIYTVTYTFSNGTCSNSTTAPITINALPTATITYTGTPYCAAGTATVTQTGLGGGTYSALPAGLSINPVSGDINLAASTPNTYTVTYGISNGTCNSSTTTSVTILALPTVVITNPAAVCSPSTVDLTAAAVTAGSTAGLTFTYFTDAAGTVTMTTPTAVAAGGTYYIKGTAASGCFVIQAVAVTINPKPTVVVTNPAAVCSPGTVDITAAPVTAGSTAGLTYTYFSDAAGTITLATAAAVAVSGTYYIKGTTAAGCSDIQPVVVTINPLPLATIAYTGTPYCATGTATVTQTGQAGGTYSSPAGLVVDATTGSIDLAASTAGSYLVTYNFTNGICSNSTTAPVTINALPVAGFIYTGSPYCATGTATVTHTGQAGGVYSAPAGVVINAVSGDINLTTSTSGTYLITYTFSNGTCSNITTASVTINALPNATITYSGSPYCATGTATVTQAGQTGGTYSSTAGLVIDATTGAVDLVASTPNTYTVTYNFGNGTCTNSTTTTIKINALPTATIAYAGSPYCATGTATVTQGGLAGGTYSSTAGLVINASTGDIDLAASTAGTYVVTYTFSNGTCSNSTTAPVTITTLPVIVITDPAAVCSPSTVDITAVAVTAGSATGLTYSYFTDAAGTIVLSNPTAISIGGTYYIKGTGASGCSDIKPVVVTINPKPVVVITNPASVCAPNTVDLTLISLTTGSTPGLVYTYYLDAAATTALASPNAVGTSGTYYLKGTTPFGCSDIKPVVVTINPLPTAAISYSGSPYCTNGTATVTIVGQTGGFFTAPASVSIDGITGDVNLAAATPGTYLVTYTFSNGTCSNSTTTSISINPNPVVNITNPAAVCAPLTVNITNATVTAGSTPGLTYTYYTDAAATVTLATPATISVSGTYYIKGTTGSGCSVVKPVVVTINPLPAATIAYTGSPYCKNGTAFVTLTGTGAGTFTAAAGLSINSATGDINLAASTEGTYTVFYSFTNGTCSNTTFTTVVVKNPPLVVNDPAGTCSPATIDLTNPAVTAGSPAGLAFNYYQDIAGTLPLTTPAAVGTSGTYYIKGVDLSTGCSTNIQPVNVTIFTKPTVTASSSLTDICKGVTITLTAVSPGNSIEWLGLGTGAVFNATPLTDTAFYAVATTTNGCSDTAIVPVTVKPFKLTLTANPDPVLAGTNTTLTTSGNFTYNVLSWSPDIFFTDQTATTQNIIVKDTSKSFTVVAQSTDGCLDTATLYVVVDPNLKDFFIPNSFSPNNDGTNDLFKVYGSSVKEVTMRVYNQWGELIFETKNAQSGWDGTWKGRPQAVGVYVYVAQVTFYNNVKIMRKGTINLIR